ncbi:hypothetical protein FHW96_000782 [Novosphingobium sp. SG751A]|uniref:ATPase n=1 Tax=Novosphingobium sp. SG751A TaxID=2587000 RepID=UPI001557265F|nr:ATPase [Novosphingobium sp. SG751A]NOW44640.1 hypothetical protein [Novosphingobium sp. SG751A]
MASGTPIYSIEAQLSSEEEVNKGIPLDALTGGEEEAGWDEAGPAPRRMPEWLSPVVALVLVLGWSALFGAGRAGAIAAARAPEAWSALALQWSPPVLLIALVYLIVQRSSRREAGRFGDAAALLRRESQALEHRLTSLNRELSLAREFLAAQTRELDALGRTAVDRIGQSAGRIDSLVRDNGAQVDMIGTVSAAALANMEQLRVHLPVITNAAKDVTSNIGNAGRIAHAHLQDMVKGLERLQDFGQSSEQQVIALRERIESGLSALESRTQQLDAVITGRFEALEARSTGFALDLERHEAEAREALHLRAAAMGDEIAATRAQLDSHEAEALTSLRARLSALRDEAATIGRSLRENEAVALGDWQAATARLTNDLSRIDRELAQRHDAAIERAGKLGVMSEATSLRLAQAEARLEAIAAADAAVSGAMEQRLEGLERRLGETDRSLEKLTESSVRLLELIQSSAHHSRETLPPALAQSEEQLAGFETRLHALRSIVVEAGAQGEMLAQRMDQAQGVALGVGHALSAQDTAVGLLRDHLAQVESEAQRIASDAQGELGEAIRQLGGSVMQTLALIESDGAARVTALVDQLSSESGAALERAMRLKAGEISGQLEQAAAHALGISREAAHQLRDQLREVESVIDHLETRVAEARDKAEDRMDGDFSRRMAIITDTLQSKAVDITRALDSEVADTAWAAYLRGDRGIFTRRAVRLLDTGDARHVLSLYESDGAFQAHVNRYIHDFEAMLRHLLSTRDGHAISVTLLSSDMGKLYVALAQAIERLRA